MKAILDTNTEVFFKYLDTHPDFKLEFSNKVIEKIAEYIVKGSYESLMDAFVKRINKELEDSDIKYEVNPAHPNRVTVSVNASHFDSSFRKEILCIASEYVQKIINFELENEIKNKIHETFISDFTDKAIKDLIEKEIKNQIKNVFKHILNGE
jgi:ribosome-associated toxin RatA of RatAB toxin-antitoxin module